MDELVDSIDPLLFLFLCLIAVMVWLWFLIAYAPPIFMWFAKFTTAPKLGVTVGCLGVLAAHLSGFQGRQEDVLGWYCIAFIGFSWAAITAYLRPWTSYFGRVHRLWHSAGDGFRSGFGH